MLFNELGPFSAVFEAQEHLVRASFHGIHKTFEFVFKNRIDDLALRFIDQAVAEIFKTHKEEKDRAPEQHCHRV